MSDLRKQLHEHYEAQELSPEKAEAILARGRGDVADAGVPGKVSDFPFARRSRRLLALAAAVMLCAGLAVWWWPGGGSGTVPFAALAPRVVEFFSRPPELAQHSQNPAELQAWLVAHGAPTDFRIPAPLASLTSEGCQVVDVRGRPAYLLCFWRKQPAGAVPGELVHLLVARRSDFRGTPGAGPPQLRELDGWSFGSWAEGDLVYTLAAHAPRETLQPFLSSVLRPRLLALVQ